MRNQIRRWLGGAALTAAFVLLFAGCEIGRSETTPAGALDLSTRNDAAALAGNEQNVRPDICACLTANFSFEDLSATEKDALVFMREEEKMARDIYLALSEKWSLPIFANIARSEQRHMDAVLCLLDKYDVTDPVGENAKGVFQNQALQTLYNQLKAQGLASLESALTAGATVEDVDIRDLMQMLDKPEIDSKDVRAVFDALLKGSRNHMRAFTSLLGNAGATYEAQYISRETLASITGTEWERADGICGTCLGLGLGYGNGAGFRNGTGAGRSNGPNAGNRPGGCIYPNQRLNRGRN